MAAGNIAEDGTFKHSTLLNGESKVDAVAGEHLVTVYTQEIEHGDYTAWTLPKSMTVQERQNEFELDVPRSNRRRSKSSPVARDGAFYLRCPMSRPRAHVAQVEQVRSKVRDVCPVQSENFSRILIGRRRHAALAKVGRCHHLPQTQSFGHPARNGPQRRPLCGPVRRRVLGQT